MTIEEIAAARAAGVRAQTDRPSQRRHAQDHDGPSAARTLAQFQLRDGNGSGTPGIVGVASVTEHAYTMYDMFGPYTEVVSASAFDATLAAGPLVEFTVNHGAGGGMPMASTRNGTLTLSVVKEGETPGLHFDASVDPSRGDVADMLKATQRGDLAEASFKFRIDSGLWSPDFTQYRIEVADIDRGDVSSVNFGANPAAFTGVRAAIAKVQSGRALDPQDVSMLTQAMAWFTALDSIVDEAQDAIATYLGVPSPDPDSEMLSQIDTAHRVAFTAADTRHRSTT